jgi:NAD(P)H-hydrate repair Nnr-like enzyme with NAD(P)H-hydrate dehydratase domain
MAFIPAVTTKGDAGKILTVAGCALYHGAPAFSAMASLRTGADLVTVWTTEEARIGLVQYPSIMAATTEPVAWAPYDALVAGPGLGRSEERWRDLRRAALAVRRDAPIVLDADALYVSEENRRLLQLLTELREARGEVGDGAVLLTPNRRELERLQRATDTTDLASLARHLAYPFILAKGERDVLATPTGRTMTLGGGGGGEPIRGGGMG